AVSAAADISSGSKHTIRERNVGTVSTTPARRASSSRRASARTRVLMARSIPSPNSTTSAVSPAGRILYSDVTGALPAKRLQASSDPFGLRDVAAADGVAARHRIVRQEPGLDADPAPQRVHKEDRQVLREQAAQLAAVEGDEDRVGKRAFDRARLDHVHP